MARSLAGPAQGSRRPGLEDGGPKIGKARQPAASGGSRRLEKSVFKYHKYCVEDGLSVDTPECRSGVSFLPAPADLPSHWLPRRSPPPLPVAVPAAPSRRPLGSSSPPTPTRRRPAAFRDRPPLPVAPPVAPSRRPLGSSSPPTPTRRLPGPPVSTGCPAGRRRLCRLLRRPLLPVGLSGVPLRRRRPVASRGHRFRPVAPPVAAASAGCCAGRSFPSASREFLSADTDPSPPEATGFDRLLRRSLLPAGHSH